MRETATASRWFFAKKRDSDAAASRPQTPHGAEFMHILSIGRRAKNPCTAKERGEFIARTMWRAL